jgi:hypothetical protein
MSREDMLYMRQTLPCLGTVIKVHLGFGAKKAKQIGELGRSADRTVEMKHLTMSRMPLSSVRTFSSCVISGLGRQPRGF